MGMELYQKFQVVQFVVILATCLVGLRLLKEGKSPEKTYILPFCLIDLVVTGVTVYTYYYYKFHFNLTILVVVFSWVEIFLISYYIKDVTGENKEIFIPLSLCIISPIISKILLEDYHLLPMVTSCIYITFYTFKYIKWIFHKESNISLKETRHYWIVLGIMLCYTTSIPYWISDLFLQRSFADMYHHLSRAFFIYFVCLNVIMHLFFIKAFLWKVQLVKSFSGQ